MMKLRTKQRRRQKGLTIVLALIVMALASLVVTGLLYFVSTSLVSHAKNVEHTKARYAADAGVEWFVAEVMDDFGAYTEEAESISVGTVNGFSVTIDITDYEGDNSNRDYIIESKAGGVIVKAQVLAAEVGTVTSVAVHEWELP